VILCFRSKFFSSNGQLREVNEVDKMNESMQAELQVRVSISNTNVFKSSSQGSETALCLEVITHLIEPTWHVE